ncbi:MAG: hypothetical protein JXR73_04165 [Candidatus Omnitrophica bacterium]|nr:hypothetical protein [Candidatus Omnitrophota bacterium]
MQNRRMIPKAWLLSLLLCAAFIAPPATVRAESLFSLLPGDAIAAVRLHSIQQSSYNLNTFSLAAAGMPLGEELETMILEAVDLKSLDGFDRDKPLWMLFGMNGEMEESISLLAPIADRDAVIASSELQKDESGVYTTGMRSIVFGEKTALFCDGEIQDYLKAWFAEAPLEQLAAFETDSRDDLSVWIRLTPLAEMLRDLSDGFIESMEGLMALNPMSSPNTVPLLKTEIGWLLDLLDQSETLRLGLQLSPDALRFHKQVHLKEGAPMADYFRTARYADIGDVLSVLDPDNFISMVINFDPKVYELTRDRILKDFQDLNMNIDDMKKMWEQGFKTYKGPIGMSINPSFKENQPIAFTQLIAYQGSADARDFLNNVAGVMKESAQMIAPATGIHLDVSEVKDIGSYKNIPYSKIAMRYLVDDPESPVAEILAKQNIDYYYALTDKTIVFTSENMPDVLDKLLSSDKPAPPDYVDKNALVCMRINLLQAVMAAKQYMAQTMQGVNPLEMVEIPPDADNPGVTFDMRIQNGDPVTRLTVPMKEIEAVRDIILGAMMQQEEPPQEEQQEEG